MFLKGAGWISVKEDVQVTGDAQVTENALVTENVQVTEDVQVTDTVISYSALLLTREEVKHQTDQILDRNRY